MKKKILMIIGLSLATAVVSSAQEYKMAKSSGKLVIQEVNRVTIEGYNGNDIVFTSLDGPKEKDRRAEGLRAINAMGLEDNTGIGLAVQEKGNTVEVYQLKRMDGPRVKIKVPKGVSIAYSHTSPHGNDLELKNVESEIEVSTVHNGVHLNNVSGPMTIKTIHGEVEADFGSNIKGPVSIVSLHGLVDISIPGETKANINLSTNHGQIFVDPAIKIDFEGSKEWVVYGSNRVNGKLNGGGLDFTLSSSHNNIYLRKK